MRSLMTPNERADDGLVNVVFHHMLQALDYISTEGIIHRDVKPENILYEIVDDHYIFQLADFGLCNDVGVAATEGKGSPLYMAPEVFHFREVLTHKVDMWSLFVTLLDMIFPNLRHSEFKDKDDDIHRSIIDYARTVDEIKPIREAANFYPKNRASAAQMLVKFFRGAGMTTPWNEVPEMKPWEDRFVPKHEMNAFQAPNRWHPAGAGPAIGNIPQRHGIWGNAFVREGRKRGAARQFRSPGTLKYRLHNIIEDP